MVAVAQPLKQIVSRQSVRPAVSQLSLYGRLLILLEGPALMAVDVRQRANSSVSRRIEDPFRAISHELSTPTHNFSISDDDSCIPVRTVKPSGEIYSGPHGKLVIVKKKQ